MQGCTFLKKIDDTDVWVDQKTGQFVALVAGKTRRCKELKHMEKQIKLLRAGVEVITAESGYSFSNPFAYWRYTLVASSGNEYTSQDGQKLRSWSGSWYFYDAEIEAELAQLNKEFDEVQTDFYKRWIEILKKLTRFQPPADWEKP